MVGAWLHRPTEAGLGRTLRQLHICHALVLLAEGHDTTRVARACGWANPSSFIAAFTAIVGTTPGRQRRAYMAPGVVLVQYERQRASSMR